MDIFSGSATLVTGIIALIVYRLHRADEIEKAAKIILLEVREAERGISQLKGGKGLDDFLTVLPVNSWNKYNHLFVKHLDQDQLEKMNEFYKSCQLIEDQLILFRRYLPLAMDTKAKSIQDKIVELCYSNRSSQKNYQKQKELFLEIIHKEQYWFMPSLPKDKLLLYVGTVSNITTSTVGAKIKKVGSLNLLQRIL